MDFVTASCHWLLCKACASAGIQDARLSKEYDMQSSLLMWEGSGVLEAYAVQHASCPVLMANRHGLLVTVLVIRPDHIVSSGCFVAQHVDIMVQHWAGRMWPGCEQADEQEG
jgi:hypothetical protein